MRLFSPPTSKRPDWIWPTQLSKVQRPGACGRGYERLELYLYSPIRLWGPDSSVDIVTRYRLDSPGIEHRWGERFFAPVQTGPGAHPAPCTMGTGSFPGVKYGRGVTLIATPSTAEVKKSTAVPLFLSALMADCRVKFMLYLHPVAYRGEGWGVQHPQNPKFRSFDKVETDCKLSGKCLVFLFQHPN